MSSHISIWGFVAPSTFWASLKIPKHYPDLARGAVCRREEVGGRREMTLRRRAHSCSLAAVSTALAGSVLDPLITYLDTVESNGLDQEKKRAEGGSALTF